MRLGLLYAYQFLRDVWPQMVRIEEIHDSIGSLKESESVSCSVVSDSLYSYGL